MGGTVEKYGTSWRIRYEVGLEPDGKRDQRSKGDFRTEREVRRRCPRPSSACAAGVDITVVSNRLGRSRSSFTADTDTRVLPEVAREAADLVAEMVRLAGGGDPAAGAP